MSAPDRLYLFEDRVARSWAPFALTRPVGELMVGARLLRERAELAWGRPCSGYLGATELAGFHEEAAPPVLAATREPHGDGPTVLLSSRVMWARDPTGAPAPPPATREALEAGHNRTLVVEETVVGWILSPGASLPSTELLAEPRILEDAAPLALSGAVLERPWDLLRHQPEQLMEDLAELATGTPDETDWHVLGKDAPLPEGVSRIGNHPLIVGPEVVLEPGVSVDLRHGPVALGREVEVRSFTRLEGPTYVGPYSMLLGGPLSRVSAGPVSRLRGEVSDSILLGYTNKAHDGYLGHSVVGRWVNLGAGTTNSDLKNNYGTVRVRTPEGDQDTGLIKVGCFLGDHVKTAIGTLLGTGAVVGAGANLFGGTPVGRCVPPFAWGIAGTSAYQVDRFVDTARTAMARRGVELSTGAEELLRRAWHRSRPPRERASGR